MKKVWNVIKAVITWLLVIAAVGMMIFTIVSVYSFDRNDRSLFGYKAFIVESDSMSKTDFSAGDLVLVKEVEPSTLHAGDIISFQSTHPDSYGETITHKIRSLTTDANGNPGFITYGTTTDTDDENVVTYEFVLGKYVRSIPRVGTFFYFLKTPPGYIVCIFLPFLLLILIQGFNSIRLFRRYKSEQLAEMEAQRAKQQAAMEAERKQLEEERAESQKMMAELLKLKEQLSGGAGNAGAGSASAEGTGAEGTEAGSAEAGSASAEGVGAEDAGAGSASAEGTEAEGAAQDPQSEE